MIYSNAEFKALAREHQIAFRGDVEIGVPAMPVDCPEADANYPIVRNPRRKDPIRVRSSLLWEDAKDNDGFRIFYSGFRKEITDRLYRERKQRSDMKIGPLVTNLLRSEHIPYNVFLPMKRDKIGAVKLFNDLLNTDRISSINDILIEHNPHTLCDGTAFDVFVDYEAADGQKGGIGIEVKYTEKEYPLKVKDKNGEFTKEYRETHDILTGDIQLAENYLTPSRESGWFKSESIAYVPAKQENRDLKHVVKNHFRQIWRNHLLGASMILSTDKGFHIDEFTSMTVFPGGNGHFSTELWTNYEEMLTDDGKATLRYLTYETLFPKMRKYLRGVEGVDRWIDYLERRYLVTSVASVV